MSAVFIRHCTTYWNRLGRVQGHTDTSLDEGGKKESVLLAEQLKSFDIQRIISSDLKRASQTAEIVADILNVSMELDSRLRECAFGSIEGLTKQAAIEKFGDKVVVAWESYMSDYDFTEFGGEDRLGVLARHKELYDELSSGAEEVILLVGHGRGLNTLLAYLGLEANLQRSQYRLIELK